MRGAEDQAREGDGSVEMFVSYQGTTSWNNPKVTGLDTSPNMLEEARQVLELGIIPLVCDRATEEDIAAPDRAGAANDPQARRAMTIDDKCGRSTVADRR